MIYSGEINYEKKYKEALEKARKTLEKSSAKDVAKLVVEYFFPELAESEDERIRKGLIEALKTSKTVGELKFTLPEPTREECITYLEKQKEQKHPNGCFTCDEYKKGYEEGRRNGFTAGYNKAMKEVEQKEQKPELPLMGGDADTYFDDLRMTTKSLTSREWFNEGIKYAQRLQKEQKPAEWSEEDEIMLENIRYALEYACANSVVDEQTTEYVMAWLSSLRLQPQGTYKQVIHTIFGMLKDKDFYEIKPSHRVSLLNDIRVKCKDAIECAPILDEPHWKPSEEQMEAIKHAYNSFPNDCPTKSNLMFLYRDLKKLM